eukprot:167398-Rhodomonas_salina.1
MPALYPHAGVTVTLTSHAVSRNSDQETEVSHPRARITRVSRGRRVATCESMVRSRSVDTVYRNSDLEAEVDRISALRGKR